MELAAVILLGLILLVLVAILNNVSDYQKNSDLIILYLYESRMSLSTLAGKIEDLADIQSIEDICAIGADIISQLENLQKDEINQAVKTLEGIGANLSELDNLNVILSSLEQSLDTIVAHPAFTTRYDDGQ